MHRNNDDQEIQIIIDKLQNQSLNDEMQRNNKKIIGDHSIENDHHDQTAKVVAAHDQRKDEVDEEEKTGLLPKEEEKILPTQLQLLHSIESADLLMKNKGKTADVNNDNTGNNIVNQQQHQQQNNNNFVEECTLMSIQSNDHVITTNITTSQTSGVQQSNTIDDIIPNELTCEGISCLSRNKTSQAGVVDLPSTTTARSVKNDTLYSADDYGLTGTKYKSLVMITQDHQHLQQQEQQLSQVNVLATNMTRIVSPNDSVIVQHTNFQSELNHYDPKDTCVQSTSPEVDPNIHNANGHLLEMSVNNSTGGSSEHLVNLNMLTNDDFDGCDLTQNRSESVLVSDDVTVVTGLKTLSAVVCLEDGLADDDSWVEEISQDEEEFATSTATDSDIETSEDYALCSIIDREEELRGFNRSAIDFTLHTIVEESCEESEVESNDRAKNHLSVSELEKYFFYGLGDGKMLNQSDERDDSLSESSSLCSEGIDSLGGGAEESNCPVSSDLASSRLEKYFLTGFMGFSGESNETDGSGSVGSDSEGHPSPEQRRKRLVRARGTPRSHNSSLDNLLAANIDMQDSNVSEHSNHFINNLDDTVINVDETMINTNTQNDSLKYKKQIKKRSDDIEVCKKLSSETFDINASDDENCKTPQPDYNNLLMPSNNLAQSRKQHSRDSGFIGSNDDLLKSNEDTGKSPDLKIELEEIVEDLQEAKENDQSDFAQNLNKEKITHTVLTRKESFNNWSSDEETNLMLAKMRKIFKTQVVASANANLLANCSKSSTPIVSESNTPKNGTPVPRLKHHHHKNKPPQLVYFENELTRLMKTVPGINDEQVREIVEYLSSEDTWSDSYDSSDYTNSDLEGGAPGKSVLQEQISASCQRIIKNFDPNIGDEEGDRGDGGLFEENQGLNRETAFVYQKLLASFTKMTATANDEHCATSDIANTSPPIFAKVMNHIGSRLVALMHEVSSGESHGSTSPRSATQRHYRKLQQAKISATTTEDDDDDGSSTDSNFEKSEEIGLVNLPRSKSHDLLLSGSSKLSHHQSSSGVSDAGAEEKESDCDRFSWRGSFESALLANGDSRSKLTLLDRDNSSSITALAAKRRSAGDLLFSQKSLSREQLDRVRSCGSIGSEDQIIDSTKIWNTHRTNKRRSSVPNSACDSDDNSSDDDDERNLASRSTLPRSLQGIASASTNSLPRLSTTNLQQPSIQKSHSIYQFLPNSVKSARYRPPGFNNRQNLVPKKAVSSPGLQQSIYSKRDTRRRANSFYSGKFVYNFYLPLFNLMPKN